MKILYKQSEKNGGALEGIGVKQCYCKKIFVSADAARITRKPHHHTGFEIHIVENGHQIYSAESQVYEIQSGQLLVIPPNIRHSVVDSSPNAAKISITFSAAPQSLFGAVEGCAVSAVPERVLENLASIAAESERRRSMSDPLIGAWVLESIVLIFRALGMKERPARDDSSDPRFFLAMQYMQDNVEQAPTVSEVAFYCGLSQRQLSRLFSDEGMSPAEAIRTQRVRRIEALLSGSDLSLYEISERMHFSDEYYFNAFFKKYAGMTPGAYRKMMS